MLRTMVLIIGLGLISLVLLVLGIEFAEKRNIRNMVPKLIKIDSTYRVAFEGSFDESYGFGLYKLDETISIEIQKQGLVFFKKIKQGKKSKWPYETWELSRGKADFSWIESSRVRGYTGFQTKFDNSLTYEIYSSRTWFHGKIVIIPELRLVNVYFSG
ncbi:MAG: hypothetical protein COA43_04470 [Robiginitomaculum sp.]|nr:MAG: hypothetical protein COA43_04470 [Robiginitomaculum sp.]